MNELNECHLPLLDDVARLEEVLAGLVTCHADLGPPLVLLLDTNFPSAGSLKGK